MSSRRVKQFVGERQNRRRVRAAAELFLREFGSEASSTQNFNENNQGNSNPVGLKLCLLFFPLR